VNTGNIDSLPPSMMPIYVSIIGAAVLLVVTLLAVKLMYRDRRERRGFEVKSSTGQTPVIREKENDHG